MLLSRTFNKRPLEERVRIRKHKIIAQAFAKRRDLNHMGRLSISIHSEHDDPMGLGNLGDLNASDAASADVSSAWAAAIPKFVTRRGAIVGAAGAFGLRRSSLDSEISMSAVRRISLESTTVQQHRAGHSRRHSFDSQYSIQSQQTTDLERLTRLHFRKGGRSKRSMMRPGRKMALRRRGSITSQASSRGSQILPAITKLANLGKNSALRGSFTSQASSTKGSQILPAITKRKDQVHPVGRAVVGATVVDMAGLLDHGGGSGAAGHHRDAKRGQDLSERIERFSLNLPGDASSDESDLEQKSRVVPAVAQSTQTVQTWNVATQTSPSLATLRPVGNSKKKSTAVQSKGTQMTSPSSSSSSSSTSSSSSPEVVRRSFPKTAVTPVTLAVAPSKCPRERGQADGSPNGTSSEDDDEDVPAGGAGMGSITGGSGAGLSSPSQSLLNYLLPIKAEKRTQERGQNGSKTR